MSNKLDKHVVFGKNIKIFVELFIFLTKYKTENWENLKGITLKLSIFLQL